MWIRLVYQVISRVITTSVIRSTIARIKSFVILFNVTQRGWKRRETDGSYFWRTNERIKKKIISTSRFYNVPTLFPFFFFFGNRPFPLLATIRNVISAQRSRGIVSTFSEIIFRSHARSTELLTAIAPGPKWGWKQGGEGQKYLISGISRVEKLYSTKRMTEREWPVIRQRHSQTRCRG